MSSEKAFRRLPSSTSSSSSSLAVAALSGGAAENSLRSKLTFFAILASFFLFLLLHQSLLSKPPSSSSSSSAAADPSSLILLRSHRPVLHHTSTSPSLRPNETAVFNNTTRPITPADLHHGEEQIETSNKTADSNTTTTAATTTTITTTHPNKTSHSNTTINTTHLNKTSHSNTTTTTTAHLNKTADSNTTVHPQKPVDEEEVRTFHPYGSAAALFVLYSAYRGGNNTFAVVGLGSKPLYVYGKPKFECFWLPSSSSSTGSHTNQSIKSKLAYTMEPDFGFGRVYTVVVLNCTFEEAVGTSPDQRGGQLVLYAFYGDGLDKPPERIVALEEDEHAYNASTYEPPYPYEYIYCGSPLFSKLNAQRMREWMAYHVMKFGPRSHFIFHDAGGLQAGVRAVLEPWKKQGFITIQNVKQTTQYDGYYYNQFLIVNDCLHRTKFMAEWTFFFDVDEYIYTPPDVSLRSVLDWHVNHTSLSFKQLRMSDSLCQFEEPVNDTRWAFEKLVYGEEFNDLKYAVQARGVFATGVHYSQKELGHMDGERGWAWWPHMRFYHYHNTISKHGKLCNNITHNSTAFTLNGRTYKLDTSMVPLGALARTFERTHNATA